MKAFKATFSSYLVEADQPSAQRAMDLIRATCISRGVQPGVAIIAEVSDEELSRLPALRSLIDRKTKPAHGPAATDQERDAAIRAIASAVGGDAGVAQGILSAVERAQGYLPRTVANALVQKFAQPETEEAAAA